MPIPVIKAVSNPETSGRSLFKREFNIIRITANIISQLPTVSPILCDKPTKRASNGEVPRFD